MGARLLLAILSLCLALPLVARKDGIADAPPKVVSRANLPVPDELKPGEALVMKVEFIIMADGSVTGARIIEINRMDVDTQAVIQTIETWRYTPPIKDGKPFNLRVRLSLEVVAPQTEVEAQDPA